MTSLLKQACATSYQARCYICYFIGLGLSVFQSILQGCSAQVFTCLEASVMSGSRLAWVWLKEPPAYVTNTVIARLLLM